MVELGASQFLCLLDFLGALVTLQQYCCYSICNGVPILKSFHFAVDTCCAVKGLPRPSSAQRWSVSTGETFAIPSMSTSSSVVLLSWLPRDAKHLPSTQVPNAPFHAGLCFAAAWEVVSRVFMTCLHMESNHHNVHVAQGPAQGSHLAHSFLLCRSVVLIPATYVSASGNWAVSEEY